MYDTTLTRMSLPSEQYRLLLGTALSVFSLNNGFLIENIIHANDSYSWSELVDKESGYLKSIIEKTIPGEDGKEISDKFAVTVKMRNRIIHGFRITSTINEQIMATKEKKSQKQFLITENYLIEFIKLNEELSNLLHLYRGY